MLSGTPLRFALAFVLLARAPALASSIDDPEVGALVAALTRGSGGEVNRAAERLRYLGPGRSGPALRQLLSSDDAHERVVASAALVLVRDPRAAEPLIAHLGDEAWEVRRNVADALAALRARSATKRLETCVLEEKHVRVRKACVRALGEIGTGARALARCGARDGELEVRLAALDALARLMDPSVAPLLRPLLTDGSGFVRFGAARALAWQGDAAARRFLEVEVAAADPERSRRAAQVLADVPKAWALDLLARALASLDADTRHAAALALAGRDDVRGRRHLARLALHGEGEELSRAVRACDELGLSPGDRQRLAAELP
jgi:HEAT repeat protein